MASIQGLRALAMLLVFSHHLHTQIQLVWPNALSRMVVQSSGLGSSLFLCVCGCFIHRSLMRRRASYGDFIGKRFLRVYPVYLFMVGAYLLIEAALKTGRLGLKGDLSDAWLVLKNLLLLPVFLGEEPMLEVSWTLAYIFAFYLIAPALAHVLRPMSRAGRIMAVTALWAVLLVSGTCPPRVTLIAGGMLCWELRAVRIGPRWIAALACAGLILRASPLGAVRTAGDFLFAMNFLLAAMGGVREVEQCLSARPLQWLGYRSYSFYLAHGLPLLAMSAYVFPRFPLGWTLLLQPVCFAASLAFAECIHRVVERRWSLGSRQSEFSVRGAGEERFQPVLEVLAVPRRQEAGV